MAASDNGYFGTYCMLENTSGSSAVQVDGNMVVIGTPLEFTREVHVTDRGKEVPRIVLSRGQNALGFLPANVYKRVAKLMDAGWTCRAYPSLSIFDKLHESYSTEVALICSAPGEDATFDAFAQLMAARIAKGEHPAVALSDKELARVREAGGQWVQTKRTPLPEVKKGTAYFKTKQTTTERLALAAASGNKGCYVALVAVVLVIIAAICLLVFIR